MKTSGAAGDANRARSAPLSLKARETASLSLKRIFEQQLQQQRSSSDDTTCSTAQYINVEDVVNVHLVDETQAPMAATAEPDLDLKLATRTSTDTSYTKITDSTSASRHDERNVGGSGSGQLTIFYAGTMCVYEDVSTDKAKAILLLACGSGDVYQSNYANILEPRIRKSPTSALPPRTPETAAATTTTTRSAKGPHQSISSRTSICEKSIPYTFSGEKKRKG